MQKFYHATPVADRPRVLGLTASPLINVKKDYSDAKLQEDLTKLEIRLDSRIVSLETWDSKEGDDYRRHSNEASEIVIHYDSMKPHQINTWPQMAQFPMHVGRCKEMQQFSRLFEDVGPFPTALYARQVVEDLVSPNAYEGETAYELTAARRYLRLLIEFCEEQEKQGFRLSNKLLVLGQLLDRQLLDCTAVGVVFVQRRITALALQLYFRKISQMDPQEKGEGPVCPVVSPHLESPDTFNSSEQFDDAEMEDDPSLSIDVSALSRAAGSDKVVSDNGTSKSLELSVPDYDRIKTGVLVRDPRQLFKSLSFAGSIKEKPEWIHQQSQIRKVIKGLRSGEINVLIATSVVEEGVDIQAWYVRVANSW